MSAIIVDGSGIARAVKNNLRAQIDALSQPLHLAAVCAGDDPSLRAFVAVKQKAAHSIGIDFSSYLIDGDDRHAAEATLRCLAGDDTIDGIFVELPLPSGWERQSFLSLIPPDKDVDALTKGALVPSPAVRALQYVLSEHEIKVRGVHAAVVGHGFLVGEPVARWLRNQGANVDVIDADTPDPSQRACHADIIVAGAGKPGLITAPWVKKGATVIDFGYAKNGDGYVGDVAFASVQQNAGVLTPVPGGMGPLVVAAVLENLVELATR